MRAECDGGEWVSKNDDYKAGGDQAHSYATAACRDLDAVEEGPMRELEDPS
jgi:hypothetical protein